MRLVCSVVSGKCVQLLSSRVTKVRTCRRVPTMHKCHCSGAPSNCRGESRESAGRTRHGQRGIRGQLVVVESGLARGREETDKKGASSSRTQRSKEVDRQETQRWKEGVALCTFRD